MTAPRRILALLLLAALAGACRTITTEGEADYQLCHQLCEMVADDEATLAGRVDAARMLGRMAASASRGQRQQAERTLETALDHEAPELRDAARAALVEMRGDLARHTPLVLEGLGGSR